MQHSLNLSVSNWPNPMTSQYHDLDDKDIQSIFDCELGKLIIPKKESRYLDPFNTSCGHGFSIIQCISHFKDQSKGIGVLVDCDAKRQPRFHFNIFRPILYINNVM